MSKITTPEFRGSFVTLDKPSAFNEGAPKYGISIPLPKDHKFWDEVDKAIKEVAMKKWGEIPKKLETWIKDGDDEPEKYGWAGMNVLAPKNKSKPGVVIKDDGVLREPMTMDEVYSGAFYKATVRAYTYDKPKKGVTFSLDNVMKTRDGERFTSRTSAEDDFANEID